MSIHTIRMPDIGEGIAEGEIVEWRVKVGDSVDEDQTLCDVMTDGSLCAMGGLTPMPVRSALTKFPEDFGLTAQEVSS